MVPVSIGQLILTYVIGDNLFGLLTNSNEVFNSMQMLFKEVQNVAPINTLTQFRNRSYQEAYEISERALREERERAEAYQQSARNGGQQRI